MYRCWKNLVVSLLFTTTLGLLPNLAAAQVLPKGVTQGPSVEGITEYRLANGLKVLLFPDASKPTVTVNVTYLVGSRHENYGETGMAHLLEHLMFKGTPRHPRLDQDFNNRGMRSNGTTSLDRTNYYESFQASDDNLKWALQVEADRMLHSFIARRDLDSEMTVVRNEFESGENSPFSVLLKRMQSVAFDWHNYGNPTIGNRSDIENVRIDNLQAFYRTYYQPDNAVLLVAGKFDRARTLGWITQAFGPMPKPKRQLPQFWTREPTQDGERNIVVRRKGDIQIISVGYKVPSALHTDSDALSFAADILADTPNGRLHKQLVETGIASQVFSYGVTGADPGLQIIAAVVKKEQAIEPVRDALITAIEAFATILPTAEEMTRVRRSDANQIEKMLSDPQQVGIGLSDAIALGDWRLLFQNRDQQAFISAQQVSAAAAKYFRRDNRSVGLFLPEDQPQRADVPVAPNAAELLKTYRPAAQTSVSEAFDPSQENIDRRTERLQIGGLDVALLPKKNRGATVSVALNLRWGDEKSLFGKRAVADLTSAMLMRGSRQFTREQLADEFSKLKISGGLFHFDTTRENLVPALRLVAQVLKEPAFPESEFEQLRQQTLVGMEAARNNPQTLVNQAIDLHFNRYPAGDWRAAESLDQRIANLKAVTLAEVKAYHQQFYGASRGEIALVGDFDPSAAKNVIDAVFGNWKSQAPYTRIDDTYTEVAPLRQILDTPDKENGYYKARLNLNLRDDDPDFAALTVANYIFGGGASLNSRLLERIRQKQGLSYGGGSSLRIDAEDNAARFTINAIAAPQNLLKVEAAVKAELESILQQGFTAEEIARAKSGLIQQRLQARAQDATLAVGWLNFLHLKRSYAWSKQLDQKIQALTAAQVNAAFRRAITPEKMTVVMGGDQAKATLK